MSEYMLDIVLRDDVDTFLIPYNVLKYSKPELRLFRQGLMIVKIFTEMNILFFDLLTLDRGWILSSIKP